MKVRIEFQEDRDMAERYEQQAKAEGMSLSAWLRRLARLAVSMPNASHSEHCTKMNDQQPA